MVDGTRSVRERVDLWLSDKEFSLPKTTFTVGPPTAIELAFFIAPLLIMLGLSVIEMENFQLIFEFTLDNYVAVFDSAANWLAFQNTVIISVLTTVTVMIVAYPLAWFITRYGGKHKNQLAILVIIPFWSNYVIRVYGLRILLSGNGVLNSFLQQVGIITEQISWLINSQFSIWFGLTYLWLPFMILPLYSSLDNIDTALIDAAVDLGAPRRKVFTRIIFPLSVPGLVAGTMFTFIFSMGAFIVPSLLGGGTSFMGTMINYTFSTASDWPGGAALGSVLMFVVIAVLGTIIRYADLEEAF